MVCFAAGGRVIGRSPPPMKPGETRSTRLLLLQFKRFLDRHQETILFVGNAVVAGQKLEQRAHSLLALFDIGELRRGGEGETLCGFRSARVLAHAGERSVNQLLAGVIGCELERRDELFHTLIFGSGNMAVLVHPKNQEIQQRGFLFLGKTGGVHAPRVSECARAVNSRRSP